MTNENTTLSAASIRTSPTASSPIAASFFRSAALKLGALASAPLVLAVASQEAFGQELPQQIVDVLNFALTLEYIEDAFYRSGLEAAASSRTSTSASSTRSASTRRRTSPSSRAALGSRRDRASRRSISPPAASTPTRSRTSRPT